MPLVGLVRAARSLPRARLWSVNFDGGWPSTGYLDNWGSPGVNARNYGVRRAGLPAYGMTMTFTGNNLGTINSASVGIGNSCELRRDDGGRNDILHHFAPDRHLARDNNGSRFYRVHRSEPELLSFAGPRLFRERLLRQCLPANRGRVFWWRPDGIYGRLVDGI